MTACRSGAWGAHATRMLMNSVYQYLHMLRRGELADAMAEVEDVRRPLAWAGVGRAEVFQYPAGLRLDRARAGEQHRRVEVALQGMGRADERAGRAEVDRPVDA